MALDYSYQQAAGIPVDAFASALHRRAVAGGVLPADSDVEGLLGRGVVTVGGAVVSIHPRAALQLDPIAIDFGFTPTVAITVRFDKFRDGRTQADELVSLAVDALAIDPGDAIGHVDYERIWLLRHDGRLIAGEHDIWTPERLVRMPYPFERGEPAFAES